MLENDRIKWEREKFRSFYAIFKKVIYRPLQIASFSLHYFPANTLIATFPLNPEEEELPLPNGFSIPIQGIISYVLFLRCH